MPACLKKMSSENESQPSLHSRTIDAGTQRATVQESTSQGKAPEQLRACESCRQRKIRCPGPSGTDDGPCEKCRSSGRSCQTRQRANRVRRKRVEVRVRELEQRILSLAANLENSSTANNGSIDVIPCSVPDASSEAFNECLTGSGNAHKIASSQRSAPVVRNRLKPTADGRILSLPTKRSRLWRKPFERSAGGCKPCKQRKVKVSYACVLTLLKTSAEWYFSVTRQSLTASDVPEINKIVGILRHCLRTTNSRSAS